MNQIGLITGVPIGFLVGCFLCAAPVYLWMIADTLGVKFERVESILDAIAKSLGAK